MKSITMQDEEHALADKYTEAGESLQLAFETYLAHILAMTESKNLEGENAQLIEGMAITIWEAIGKDLEDILNSTAATSRAFTEEIAADDTYEEIP
ncbi:MAG: hypothetical protein FWF88_03550 [Peptococcaceae bacterium]|nr:hypothetical protein [Peptococcaceae bacterium]